MVNDSMVPLKFEGVIVGVVELTENQELSARIMYPATEIYFKELLAHGLVRGINLDIDYVEELEHIPQQGQLGHIQSI